MPSVTYYNTYPEYKSVQYENDLNEDIAIDFESIKQCIRDFDAAMITAGMIRTLDPGQLDINNIEKIKYHSVYGTAARNTEAFAYDPLIYTFNDALNIDHPLYIKVIFSYVAVLTKSSTYKNNHLYLRAVLHVSKTSDFLSYQGVFPAYLISAPTNQNSLTETMVSCHTVANSEIINECNNLFINLCPNYTPNSSINTWSLNLSLICILINRKPNGDVLIYGSIPSTITVLYTSAAATIEPYKVGTSGNITTAKTGGLNIYSDILNNKTGVFTRSVAGAQFNPILQNSAYSLDGNIYLNPGLYTTDKNYYNYDVCCINRELTATYNKNATFTATLLDGTLATYKVIGYPVYPMVFASDNTALLVRIK